MPQHKYISFIRRFLLIASLLSVRKFFLEEFFQFVLKGKYFHLVKMQHNKILFTVIYFISLHTLVLFETTANEN